LPCPFGREEAELNASPNHSFPVMHQKSVGPPRCGVNNQAVQADEKSLLVTFYVYGKKPMY
jgi:hypothetical protein